MWLAEVKGISNFTGAKWELEEYFKEFQEDFNTASFPNVKYYDYERWEMEEYKRNQEGEGEHVSKQQSDEAVHRAEQRAAQEKKRNDELRSTMAGMSREKMAEMRGKELLKAEMENAYKMGDSEKVEKIQLRMKPDPKEKEEAHPWA